MLDFMRYLATEPILVLLIGIVIGFIIGKSQKKRFKSVSGSKIKDNYEDKKVRINPIFNKNASLDFKPSLLSSSSKKDKFTKIKGIDEELEAKLYDLGVYQYDQIALWTSKNCEWIENFLGISGYIKENQWLEQAKILRTGRETNYSQKLIDEENKEPEDISENKEDSKI
ncbi:hypothetical protein [Arcobacter porcinus]|uniref:hypothetical protein n=1 Tax=Arcobacter porcinus TaxID=1935204 RepID=UPI00081D7340|nr:hypothetical protein [Arcobacter porcinus]OCL84246.1 NADH dehydrogenase subunit E [Arcobacter porcinus]OCL84766.1 NADH dehydrogenase subunit E [Arcobacter porcinus]